MPVIESANQYILHVAGANADVTPEDVMFSHFLWEHAKILLVQGEIPAAASIQAAILMHRQDGLVICDPAPADSMTPELLPAADILTPNTQELHMLTHSATEDLSQQVARVWAEYPHLLMLIVTLRAEGVWFQQKGEEGVHMASPCVRAIDPTAAGDAFNGAFASRSLAALPLERPARSGVAPGLWLQP